MSEKMTAKIDTSYREAIDIYVGYYITRILINSKKPEKIFRDYDCGCVIIIKNIAFQI